MFTADEPCLAQRPTWLAVLLDALRHRANRIDQERLVRLTLRSLNHLDARTLRDIGLDASELSSAAHEAIGLIGHTRLRVWSQFDTRV